MDAEDLKSGITSAIGAHGLWKMRLRSAIRTQRSDLQPAEVRCDDRCDFGRWLHGPDFDRETRDTVPYQVVLRLHREFHIAAASVIEAAQSEAAWEAEDIYQGEFIPRSEKLVRALTKWKHELG